jgi:hypothetical protein
MRKSSYWGLLGAGGRGLKKRGVVVVVGGCWPAVSLFATATAAGRRPSDRWLIADRPAAGWVVNIIVKCTGPFLLLASQLLPPGPGSGRGRRGGGAAGRRGGGAADRRGGPPTPTPTGHWPLCWRATGHWALAALVGTGGCCKKGKGKGGGGYKRSHKPNAQRRRQLAAARTAKGQRECGGVGRPRGDSDHLGHI